MKYRVTDKTTGINYPGTDGKQYRVESGELADAIPQEALKWYLERGYVEPVEETTKPLTFEVSEEDEDN